MPAGDLMVAVLQFVMLHLFSSSTCSKSSKVIVLAKLQINVAVEKVLRLLHELVSPHLATEMLIGPIKGNVCATRRVPKVPVVETALVTAVETACLLTTCHTKS